MADDAGEKMLTAEWIETLENPPTQAFDDDGSLTLMGNARLVLAALIRNQDRRLQLSEAALRQIRNIRPTSYRSTTTPIQRARKIARETLNAIG